VLAAVGFEALPTTSSFAFTLGRLDGTVTLDEEVAHAAARDAATDLPCRSTVVEALTTGDQRLAQAEDRLRRRVATPALLHRHPVEQLANAEPVGQFPHEHKPGMRRDLLRRGRDPDQRRPLCYLHLQECLPVTRLDVSQHPC
jgi:hypothetical protein